LLVFTVFITGICISLTEQSQQLYCGFEIAAADNGLVLLMWIGLAASSDFVRNVLGVASVAQVDIDKV